MNLLQRYLSLIRHAAWPGARGIARPTARHYLATFGVLLVLPFFLVYHAIGFALDELLFRGYRRVKMESPVFVLGPPRSATTAVHSVLAEDRQFTTFQTWECFFGLSVSWRKLWSTVGRADARVGRPLGRLVDAVARRLAGGLEAVHPVRLDAPEEDYFAFGPLLWCFLLVVPFPDTPWLWRWGRFDEALEPEEKSRLMASYRRAIQRHLYAHPGKRYLAKNAAFAPLAQALLQAFPDARVVCCLREPREALSSQLSCLDPSLRGFHGDYDQRRFANRMAGLYGFYYRNLFAALGRPGSHRAVFLPVPALGRLPAAVGEIYRALGLEADTAFRERVVFRAQAFRDWRSDHRHRPAELAVDAHVLRSAFDDLAGRFDFTGDRVVVCNAPRDQLARVAGL